MTKKQNTNKKHFFYKTMTEISKYRILKIVKQVIAKTVFGLLKRFLVTACEH